MKLRALITPVSATGLLRPRITQDTGIHKLVASAAFGQIRPVLSTFRRRLRAAVTAAVGRIKSDGEVEQTA
jgi:hypothetical protein